MKKIILFSILFISLLSQNCSFFKTRFDKDKIKLIEKIITNPDSIEQYCKESILLSENFINTHLKDIRTRKRIIEEINYMKNDKYNISKEIKARFWDANLKKYRIVSHIYIISEDYNKSITFTFYENENCDNWELVSIMRYIDTFPD